MSKESKPLIKPGLTNEISRKVEEGHLASVWGSGFVPVLGTPMLVAFCEECARLAVDPLLPEGQQTVGSSINIKHLAPTPPGMHVQVRAELVEVDRRRLNFRIEVWDEVERIGEAEHERFMIDGERFKRRVATKASHMEARPDADTDPAGRG